MSIQLTPWFPPDSKPVREGVYETHTVQERGGFSRWISGHWSVTYASPADAAGDDKPSLMQRKLWRGFTDGPNAELSWHQRPAQE